MEPRPFEKTGASVSNSGVRQKAERQVSKQEVDDAISELDAGQKAELSDLLAGYEMQIDRDNEGDPRSQRMAKRIFIDGVAVCSC